MTGVSAALNRVVSNSTGLVGLRGPVMDVRSILTTIGATPWGRPLKVVKFMTSSRVFIIGLPRLLLISRTHATLMTLDSVTPINAGLTLVIVTKLARVRLDSCKSRLIFPKVRWLNYRFSVTTEVKTMVRNGLRTFAPFAAYIKIGLGMKLHDPHSVIMRMLTSLVANFTPHK